MSQASSAPAARPEFPRHYVAASADFGTWETAEPYFRELSERQIAGVEQFEKWLIDISELEAGFDEEGTGRYTAMTCQTDDAERQQRYLDFIEHVQPKAEPWRDKLRRKFMVHAEVLPLPPKRYEVLRRSIRNAIELYREENIPLLVEDQKLKTEYQSITAAMTCQYDGKEQTLQQLARYLEEPDRKVREDVWRLGADRFLKDAAALDELYVKMVGHPAQNRAERRLPGFPRVHVPGHGTVRLHAPGLPGVSRGDRAGRRARGAEAGRRTQAEAEAQGAAAMGHGGGSRQSPALAAVRVRRAACGRVQPIFQRVDTELGKVFDTLRERSVLDLGSRKGKAPGGYQVNFAERRMPFIFMNAVGTETDVRTLLHEGGHAFHSWACRNEPFIAYRSAPIEFSEVASMGMECLALPITQEFFGDDTGRATKQFFEKIVAFFPFMASIDAYQHYVYTHVDEGIERWKDHWQTLTKRFAPELDRSGLEAHERQGWQKKLHIYEVPFYYVEYGIAQLGALQVWKNSLDDHSQAVARYRAALALGGARPLPELFKAAGLKFDFSEATLRPLIEAVMEKIATL